MFSAIVELYRHRPIREKKPAVWRSSAICDFSEPKLINVGLYIGYVYAHVDQAESNCAVT